MLTHGGQNVIRFAVAEQPGGELTPPRNNAAVVQISGVRDRLRVLLVSGQPHPGTRTWRNLLKSDASVDLVHFTILRPPNKQDGGVPVSELSLIAFPTQELFLEKVSEFDLIIFDRYMLRGILPGGQYLGSVRDYVLDGGAVLVAAGPDFATAQSLARSPPLGGDILPATPSSHVIERDYLPGGVTDLGARHPVTRGLEGFAPPPGGWGGRWLRLIEVEARDSGQVVMQGGLDRPLLSLDRVGEGGRVALLASDHAWLWSRGGYEGGGPQLELLRRLAHWMMKEPELEEEALSAQAEGGLRLVVTRRTLGEGAREVIITRPDGGEEALPPLTEEAPGLYRGSYLAPPEMGLYRLEEGDLTAVAALGPAAPPREFEQTVATEELLAPPSLKASGGVAKRLEDGIPALRAVRAGRPAAGPGWIGYTPRDAYVTTALTVVPLAPAWLILLVLAGLAVGGAWLWEGRRRGGTG